MSGNFDDEGPRWPDRDINRDPPREPPQPPPREPFYRPPEPTPTPPPEPQPPIQPTPPTEASQPSTSLGDAIAGGDPDGGSWDPRRDGDRRRPTTAEQAVPWLIGLLLGLTGIVIVLLALIFIGPEGVAGLPTASPTPSVSEARSLGPTAAGSPTVAPTAAPTATPPPTFGALEMTFLGRASANTPIRLSRRDFSTTAAPVVIAEDPQGIEHYAWAPDGSHGAAIIGSRAVAIVNGQKLRTLTDPVEALVFGADSSTLYGLRVTRNGANDRAEVLTIDFATGATKILATIAYPHPDIFPDPPLKEAQFADTGGVDRLFVTTDGYLVAWMLGAPGSSAYRIDPANGTVTNAANAPVLWSPNQLVRVTVTENKATGVATLALVDMKGATKASVQVTGLVSHVRWASSNNEIVFTLGRLVGGGVRQDLYVWDLVNGKKPAPLTSNGASFGAEWLGVLQSWAP
jgi:hypothetical protein